MTYKYKCYNCDKCFYLKKSACDEMAGLLYDIETIAEGELYLTSNVVIGLGKFFSSFYAKCCSSPDLRYI